jgi:thymidylate synthase (FAD)
MLNVILKPTVRIVGRQVVDEQALYEFLADNEVASWTTDTEVGAEKLVEVAGRLCYMSFAKPRPGGNSGYVDHILESGHGSVLEHAVFNLIIEGVSRSLTHELVRHRAGFGYSQLSQRFVNESDCSFVVPPVFVYEVEQALSFYDWFSKQEGWNRYTDAIEHHTFRSQSLTADGWAAMAGIRWLAVMEKAQADYSWMSDLLMSKYTHIADTTARRKAARQAARSVLPNATETKIFVTGNARALRHFIEMRGSLGADVEIRRMAVAVQTLLEDEAPNLFGDYERKSMGDESVFISGGHRKV